MKNFTWRGFPRKLNFTTMGIWRLFKQLSIISIFLLSNVAFAQTQPAANLDQVRNGEVSEPNIPGEWVNGNLGPEQAHLAEGFSVPYRVQMSNLTPGMTVTIVLEYDVKHTGKHALDFLTNYDFMEPHEAAFGHVNQEALNPTLGTVFSESYPAIPDDEFEIPNYTNDSYSIAVKDGVLQPKTIQNVIRMAGGTNMAIWNGDIINISYGPAANLNASNASQQIKVRFIVGNEFAPNTKQPVLLAWGGHIASRADWDFDDGQIASAGGISGSPYHMRLISWGTNVDGTTGINNLGNQDRSLKASAVVPPPSCTPNGPTNICEGDGVQQYSATTDNLPGVTYFYQWTILDDDFPNTSGATFPDGEDLTLENVSVNPGGPGEYTLQVRITSQFGSNECKITTTVDEAPEAGTGGSDRFCIDEDLSSVSLFGLVTGGDAGGSWTDEADASVSDPIDLSGFAAGTYVFTYTVGPSDPDSECASDNTSVSITIDPLPEFTTQIPDLDCFASAPSIAVNSDTTGLEFSLWKQSAGTPGEFFDYLSPYLGLDQETVYILTARDKETLCTTDFEFTTGRIFDSPLNPTVEATQPSCESTGVIFVTSRTTDLRFAILLTSEVPGDIKLIPDASFLTYPISGFTGYGPGAYSVFAKSNDGCLSGQTTITLIEPICDNFEGCTLGYWKNHTDRWTCYSTCTLYGVVFEDAPSQLSGLTLLEVLNLGGGGIYNLGRQSVAALLNTCHGDVNYEILSTDELIAYVNANFNNAGAAGSYLDELNNAGCTLGGSRATTAPSTTCPSTGDTKPGKGKPNNNTKAAFTASFSAYPVPFRETLNIKYEFDYKSDVSIQFFDMQGRLLSTYKAKKVSKGDVTNLNLDFATRASQVYIVKVKTDRDVFTKNIISDK